jgi:hypothetical protein
MTKVRLGNNLVANNNNSFWYNILENGTSDSKFFRSGSLVLRPLEMLLIDLGATKSQINKKIRFFRKVFFKIKTLKMFFSKIQTKLHFTEQAAIC